MADVRGPLDTKVCPVDSTLAPWIRVGYENRLSQYYHLIQYVVTYSTKAATNILVSEKWLMDE